MSNKRVVNRAKMIKNVPLKQEVAVLIISTECFGTMEKQDIVEKVSEAHKKLGGRETPTSRVQTSVTGALNKLVKQGKAINLFVGTYHFLTEEEEGRDSVYLFYYPTY